MVPSSAALCLASALALITTTTATPGSLQASARIARARSFDGLPFVGALFPPGSSTHVCTASVVHSPGGDLLVSAAHCLSGSARSWRFAPGYHEGRAPYGYWSVTAAYAPTGWITNRDPQEDVAFLRVASQPRHDRRASIESLTGAPRLSRSAPAGTLVSVPAYEFGSHDRPITCTSRIYYTASFPSFACTPYKDGTSGAPFLERTARTYLLTGEISGLHQGGCTPQISYSAPFGQTVLGLYHDLGSGEVSPSYLPPHASDGCPRGL